MTKSKTCIYITFVVLTTTLQCTNAVAATSETTLTSDTSTPITSYTSTNPTWLNRCNQLAPCTGVLCSLAPLPTFVQISRDKSVGKLPLLPYSSMIVNGFVWTVYGILQQLPSLWSSNSLGMILGMYYFIQFKRYGPPGMNNLPGTISQHQFTIISILLANTFILTNFSKETAARVIGKEGILVFFILFASPLAAIKTVISTKSTATIPLHFTIASAINCSLWSVVGLFNMKDANVYIPSTLGLCCALVQLFLKGVYDDKKGVAGGKGVDDGLDAEMTDVHLHVV